jgi:hypothetical protein
VVAAVARDVVKDVDNLEEATDNATMTMTRDKTEMKEAKEAKEEEAEVAPEAAVEAIGAIEGVPEEPREAAVEATRIKETIKTIMKANAT